MPNFTKIPKSFRDSYKSKFELVDNAEIAELSKNDPVIFGYYHLGKTVRLHQAYIINKILTSKNKRIAICWARQLGKSICLGIFIIWCCWYNKYPVTISSITTIYLVSKEDESSVELIEKIRLILYDGDRHMCQYVSNETYFSGSLKEPNNSHQITFVNNSFVKSIPPTMKAVGKSASWLLIDEAHRLRCSDTDPDTFFDFAVAIVAETGGGIILSSTPEGITGFFYRAIDPDDQFEDNEYQSYWFDHTIWNDNSVECVRYQKFVQEQKKRMIAAGRYKYWQQEYGALFTVTETAFFDHSDVDEALTDTPMYYEWKETPCSVGYDYGQKISRTVITIRTTVNNEIIQLFQYQAKAGFDNNLLRDPKWEHCIQNLEKRYNLSLGIYGDDCPGGDDNNRWIKKNIETPLFLYNFRSDQMSKSDGINRNCVAYSYKARLKEGKLKIPKWNKTQQFEMKTVQETEQKVLISIKAPVGQLCDTFDSDMMACIPHLDMKEQNTFEVDVYNTSGILSNKTDPKNPKYDYFHSPSDDECRRMIKDLNNNEY